MPTTKTLSVSVLNSYLQAVGQHTNFIAHLMNDLVRGRLSDVYTTYTVFHKKTVFSRELDGCRRCAVWCRLRLKSWWLARFLFNDRVIVNDELETVWKEVVFSYVRYYLNSFLEAGKKTIKTPIMIVSLWCKISTRNIPSTKKNVNHCIMTFT